MRGTSRGSLAARRSMTRSPASVGVPPDQRGAHPLEPGSGELRGAQPLGGSRSRQPLQRCLHGEDVDVLQALGHRLARKRPR